MYHVAVKRESVVRTGLFAKGAAGRSEGRFAMVAVAAALFLTAIVSVWSSAKVVSLGYEISMESRRLNEVREMNGKLRSEMAMLKSPGRIEPLAKDLFHLLPPSNHQIVLIK